MTGHWALWEKYIEHGDISIGNLMCDPDTRRGVLNDLDLARMGGPSRKPSAKDNTGTMPFLALDLLNEAAFDGGVQRRYRHDAESFAWCLIYICVCMGRDSEGRIRTVSPHPLLRWFGNVDTSYRAKSQLKELDNRLPLHEATKPLAKALHVHWMNRFFDSQRLSANQQGLDGPKPHPSAAEFILSTKAGLQTQGSYEEPSDIESFKEMLQVVVGVGIAVPQPLLRIYLTKLQTVKELYPFVFSPY